MEPSVAIDVPSGHTPDGGVLVGNESARRRLVLFEDPQCPYCRRFEEVSGDLLRREVAAGAVAIEYRMRCFLGVESVRADNALALAAVAGQFDQLRREIFAAQPLEHTGGFTVDDLLEPRETSRPYRPRLRPRGTRRTVREVGHRDRPGLRKAGSPGDAGRVPRREPRPDPSAVRPRGTGSVDPGLARRPSASDRGCPKKIRWHHADQRIWLAESRPSPGNTPPYQVVLRDVGLTGKQVPPV